MNQEQAKQRVAVESVGQGEEDPRAPQMTELERLLLTREQIDERIAQVRYEQRLADLRERIVREINRAPRPPGMILHALTLIGDEVRRSEAEIRGG